jgi:surface antigen
MRASAHSNIRPFAYDDYGGLDPGGQAFDGGLSPDERIGRPLKRRGRKLLWGIVLLLIAFGATWGLYGHPSTWPVERWANYATRQATAVYTAIERKWSEFERRPAAAADQPKPFALEKPLPPPEHLPAIKTAVAPVAPDPAKAPVSPIVTGSLPPAADKVEPLPPLKVDRSDPYQVKAEAVGLHPGLSRVLLTRLSEADYRNAGIAIKTALAETPEGSAFLYPRERKAGLALFKVHFVQGVSSDCRRYVVTITKDGWATTAFPMEKCGAQYNRKLAKRLPG